MPAPSRQLAAIMYTDIVGYTGMMQRDEPGTLHRLEQHRLILEKTVNEHYGQVQQYFGDGSLIIFNSVYNAIKCSIKIQEQSGKSNIPLRIGLHVGEVIKKDGVIFGDGLNIASRVESLGVKGSVLISGSVYEHIHNQPEFKIKTLGKFKLRNVRSPVKIFSVTYNGMSALGKGPLRLTFRPHKKFRPFRYLEVLIGTIVGWIRKG